MPVSDQRHHAVLRDPFHVNRGYDIHTCTSTVAFRFGRGSAQEPAEEAASLFLLIQCRHASSEIPSTIPHLVRRILRTREAA